MSSSNQHMPNLDDVTGDVDGMFTLDELASILRVTPRTLRNYINRGKIPSHLYSRVGGYARGRLRFTAEQVRAIAKLWAGQPPATDLPVPPQQTGMVPYRPRRTGRPG